MRLRPRGRFDQQLVVAMAQDAPFDCGFVWLVQRCTCRNVSAFEVGHLMTCPIGYRPARELMAGFEVANAVLDLLSVLFTPLAGEPLFFVVTVPARVM